MPSVNDPSEFPPELPEYAAAWLVERRAELLPALEAAAEIGEPIAELKAVLAVVVQADNDLYRVLWRALNGLYVLDAQLDAAEARIELLEARVATLKPNWRADA